MLWLLLRVAIFCSGDTTTAYLTFLTDNHMSAAIASHEISSKKNVDSLPLVNYRLTDLDADKYKRQIEHYEYYWGLQKGQLDLNTPLNHLQLRSDMAKKLDKQEWIVVPTKENMNAIIALSRYNQSQDVDSRRPFTEVLPEVEYEYEFVPLYINEQRRPSLYIKQGNTTTIMHPPFDQMPRIKSRAHPLFVIFRSEDVLSLFISEPNTRQRQLTLAAGTVIYRWIQPPPPEFLVGPDVWREHRHPLSDDGSEARAQLQTKTSPRTRAPCAQPKTTTRPSIYDSQQRPMAVMTSALPVYRLSGRRKSFNGVSRPELVDWISSMKAQANTPCSSPDLAANDFLLVEDPQLTDYRSEPARDPANALRLSTFYNTGGMVIGSRGSDRSRYSSNDWAMHVYSTCLWSHKPPKSAHIRSKTRPWA
ncbi:uncharacterized protein SCHCODRAFT_0237716 [Schizophyllum commune H4-8]|uniref:Uncharacterized protein n=1 Tax=Schizophyllum commune (strain H4-8 / FGSC 9210) TaxID=578458 RepID=D8QGX7_SCHCM|nr:uncharacterized protein SCHCODRAFT_0237716 [Schizophyllum commune H4-8]KAI5886940.1 hypothetical protein SCHCODRAFT_0237716 [Schizophyllum commune H4-8]